VDKASLRGEFLAPPLALPPVFLPFFLSLSPQRQSLLADLIAEPLAASFVLVAKIFFYFLK
jgi:hypothetical protein